MRKQCSGVLRRDRRFRALSEYYIFLKNTFINFTSFERIFKKITWLRWYKTMKEMKVSTWIKSRVSCNRSPSLEKIIIATPMRRHIKEPNFQINNGWKKHCHDLIVFILKKQNHTNFPHRINCQKGRHPLSNKGLWKWWTEKVRRAFEDAVWQTGVVYFMDKVLIKLFAAFLDR